MAAKLIGERLPQNWSYGVARDGRIFFVDDSTQSTTWLHPLTGQPVQTGYETNEGLPPGWEQALTVEGAIYFIDHNNRRTTFEHPVTGRSPIKDSSVRSPQSPDIKPSPHRKSVKSKNIKAPSASRGENSKVIMRGWLHKQESGGLRLWKRKWCVLADFGLFFYKDDSEQTAIGSILLPSYVISPCSQSELNKKYAFKAEHENMKTYYFAADNQPAMEQWVEALRMASQLQRAPGSSSMDLPKLVPKSPIMTWNEDLETPDVTPREDPQFPYGGDPNTSRDSFRDRSPLQQRQNTQPLRSPYEQDGHIDQQQRYPNDHPSQHRGHPNDRVSQGQDHMDRSRDPRFNQPGYFDDRGPLRDSQRSGSHGYNPSGDYGTLAYDPQGQIQGQMNVPQNRLQGRPPDDSKRSMDNRYPSDRLDQSRMSQRSTGQDQPSLPDDQRSMTSVGQSSTASYPRRDQYSTSSLPRGQKNGTYDPRAPSGSFRGERQGPQNYNSLPREPRHHDAVSRSGRGQGHRRGGPASQSPPGRYGDRRDDKNPYMVMSSPQSSMDGSSRPLSSSRHSNRPLPQQPQEPARPPASQAGGGDYASLTRYNRDNPRYQDQQQQPDVHSPSSTHSSQSPDRQKPDLYVDIPHTYVNVYDSSQVRDEPPELPSRPPLPAEMRHLIVEDIAQNRTPNTQNDMLTAERNLELRMQQPAYFDYPTPRQTDSPRSQRSAGNQRPRQPVPTPRGQNQHRPDLAPPRTDHRGNLPDRNTKFDNNRQNNDLEGSDDTLTNDDKKSELREGFYSLGRYNEKAHGLSRHPSSPERKNRFMSDMDVRTQTLPSRPRPGDTGEKDFRLRSLPDHVQSMPSIYHEQSSMPPVTEQARQQSAGSYMNLSPPSIASDSKLLVVDENEDPNERKSAFRPLSSASKGSNSLQRLSSVDGSVKSYPTPSQPEAQLKHAGYFDPDRMELRKSAPVSQVPMQQSPWQPHSDTLPTQPQMNGPVGTVRGRDRGQRAPATIHTVKEDPNMPDSDVIATELPQRVFPLNGPRLRMSISAGDLLGKTHDELVLLLIQLRRDKADLTEQRNELRKTIEQGRPAEFRYRKLQNEGEGRIDQTMEIEHQRYMETKHRCEEIEKKLEVYKPIVNLVCNMVTMGSLYGGDNLMLATEYRKHLLSPDQYSPPKKMLEFSRKQQEDTIVKEIEDDVKQLTQDEADLEEKLDRLYDLDRMIQEQSFQVTSLKEDRELLEKALGGLLKKQDENCTNARELDKLIQQQRTIERELSRVLQQLAEASKELEETTAECNRVEHEVALLRSKVHGDMSRSRSAPSLSNESLRTKMKMEKDLAKVKNIMEGLSKEGARLQEVMSTLRKAAPGVIGADKPLLSSSQLKDPKKSSSSTTYYETDMDTNESKDLAQVTALLASYQLTPGIPSISQSPPGFQPLTSEIANKYNSQPKTSDIMSSPTSTYHASPLQSGTNNLDNSQLETDGADQWDIGDADDNTKKYFGLIPRNMPKTTVRDVKHRSEQRREERKKEDDPPLRVGVIPSHSDYQDSAPVYENLPQPSSSVISPVKPWTAILSDSNNPSSTERRRSNLQLMAPKPYTPYNRQSQPQSQTVQSYSGIPAENPPEGFSRTPPPPPVRGQKLIQPETTGQSYTAAPFSMTSALNGHVSPQGQRSPHSPGQNRRSPHSPGLGRRSSPRQQDLLKVPAWEKPIPKNRGRIIGPRRSANKGRYLTISSSQPIKLEKEKSSPQSPKHRSQAGDLISSSDVPDIIKSSTARIENFDEDTIDREILYMPEKVLIPERYIPDSDDEDLSPMEKAIRQEKAEKIKRILTQQRGSYINPPLKLQVATGIPEVPLEAEIAEVRLAAEIPEVQPAIGAQEVLSATDAPAVPPAAAVVEFQVATRIPEVPLEAEIAEVPLEAEIPAVQPAIGAQEVLSATDAPAVPPAAAVVEVLEVLPTAEYKITSIDHPTSNNQDGIDVMFDDVNPLDTDELFGDLTAILDCLDTDLTTSKDINAALYTNPMFAKNKQAETQYSDTTNVMENNHHPDEDQQTEKSVHSLSQPDVSKVAGEVHERVQQEKMMRAQLLGINQELAEQVKKKSRQYAAERRKTWSGTPSKSDEEKQDASSPRSPADDSYISNHSDANNNSYSNEQYDSRQDPYNRNYDEYSYDKQVSSYGDDTRGDSYTYSKGDHSYLPTDSFSYHKPNYSNTSYMNRPNFKI